VETLQNLHDILAQRHRYAQDWKARTRGRVVGCLCTYLPEEVVSAAGALPVRILCRHPSQNITEGCCSSGKWCSFSRDCLAAGLEGEYAYLDGLAIATNCFHYLQSFGSWVQHRPVGFHYTFYFPSHIQSGPARACLTSELAEFKVALEQWTGRAIGEPALDRAIETCNQNRRLLKKIYEYRKLDPPLLSGAETMEIVLASQVMDKAEHNVLLERLMAALPGSPDRLPKGVRLMVIGSGSDDTDLIRSIESWGASVVIDEHCSGSRYFWNEVIPGPDRLVAIADRYIQRPPCPVKDYPERRRLPRILELARDYHVQGAVLLLQKRCEPHEYDTPVIESFLKQNGIPAQVLEIDSATAVGQVRTRVEALLEMIRIEPC
jgi:benzoyl-CoA reductase subunit C